MSHKSSQKPTNPPERTTPRRRETDFEAIAPYQDRRKYFDAGAQLGATYSTAQTAFRIFAPSAEHVTLVLSDELTGHKNVREIDLHPTRQGIWETVVPGNLENKFYAYKLHGPNLTSEREVPDVYATCAQGRHARSMIVDLRKTDPPQFRTHQYQHPHAPTDAIIYEMHVRDFSIADSAGIQHRGKYLGLTEHGTHLPRHPTVRTGLNHLIELGVTHVQLLPVQAFYRATQDDADYRWGYMPIHLFSPKGWYATGGDGPTAIRELKQAVHALHEANIGVILDVVFNHTAMAAGFEKIVPDYYFRKTGAGKFSNGSGCGNEFRSESPMARKFIIDAVTFWAREYQIDGFRFDMMALLDIDTMKQIRRELNAIDPRILLYGEPWVAGRTVLKKTANKQRIAATGIGAFNDAFRDAIRGDLDGTEPGFMQKGERIKDLLAGLAGHTHPWPTTPTETINYFACHDNLTAWDKLVKSTPHTSVAVRERMLRLGALILLSSQGIPFIHAGQEFCRSKQGHHNTYNMPDAINAIDWWLKRRHTTVYHYFRGLIALRKTHPALRLSDKTQVEQRVSFDETIAPRCVAYRIDGRHLSGESARELLILLNGNSKAARFEVGTNQWHIHADADTAGLEPLGQITGTATIPAHSGMMLIR